MERGPKGIEIIDPLTLRVKGIKDIVVEEEIFPAVHGLSDKRIVAIQSESLPRIDLGCKVTIGRSGAVYRVNSIKQQPGKEPVFHLRMARRTRSCLFLLPMMPGNRSAYFYDSQLVNVFVRVPWIDHDVVALLYRFNGVKEFVDFEGTLTGLPNFIEMKDISKALVLYVFHVPEMFKSDCELFLSGGYSKFSDAYKDRILRFHAANLESFFGQILTKDEKKKKELEGKIGQNIPANAEVYSVPDMADETFDPTIYDI